MEVTRSAKQQAWLDNLRAQIRLEAYQTAYDWVRRLHYTEVCARFDAKVKQLTDLRDDAIRRQRDG